MGPHVRCSRQFPQLKQRSSKCNSKSPGLLGFFSPNMNSGYYAIAEICGYSCLGNENTQIYRNSLVTVHTDLDKTLQYLGEQMSGMFFKLLFVSFDTDGAWTAQSFDSGQGWEGRWSELSSVLSPRLRPHPFALDLPCILSHWSSYLSSDIMALLFSVILKCIYC